MGLGDTPRMEDVFARREPQLLLVEFVDEVLIACRARILALEASAVVLGYVVPKQFVFLVDKSPR